MRSVLQAVEVLVSFPSSVVEDLSARSSLKAGLDGIHGAV